MPNNDTIHAYAAGFFDGEGCIHKPTASKGITISIEQRNIEPLRFLQHMYGGYTYEHEVNNEFSNYYGFQWYIFKRRDVRAFLSLVLPYLIVKREAAERAIEVLDGK